VDSGGAVVLPSFDTGGGTGRRSMCRGPHAGRPRRALSSPRRACFVQRSAAARRHPSGPAWCCGGKLDRKRRRAASWRCLTRRPSQRPARCCRRPPYRDRRGQRLDAHFDRLAERARIASGARRSGSGGPRACPPLREAWGAARGAFSPSGVCSSHGPLPPIAIPRGSRCSTPWSRSSPRLRGQGAPRREDEARGGGDRASPQRRPLLVGRVREGERLAAERPHLAAERRTRGPARDALAQNRCS
jgi:hypothetical protein